MKLPLLQILRSFRASYWFVPSLMLIAAIGLGALTVWLDVGPAADLLNGVSWYQQSKPEGARQVLSTIAGSMITVTGVVFSITIVAISFAAGQYGPRILTNFMTDRGNQITLGTFVATFAYSIVVLRTIHGGDSGFVPQLAVMVALFLALCSIAVLIYFIHHVPESIHINTITARVGRQLSRAIDREFPADIADPPEAAEVNAEQLERAAAALFDGDAQVMPIGAERDGYLQALDSNSLVELARNHGLVFRIDRTPGNFLLHGQPILTAAPAGALPDSFSDQVQRCWTIGTKRTPDEDPLFLVDELVEVAARALSTGVNDPHTAATCVDWLSAAAARIAARRAPSPYRVDQDGKLRVVAPAADFALHIDRSFGQLRPYLARDVNATGHALASLAAIARVSTSSGQRRILAAEMLALTTLAEEKLQGPSRERVAKASSEARATIAEARIAAN